MAETTQEKSTGLTFAEQQLLRHGWEKGKGLGKTENGISEAIKVKIKCGKGGMGHKEGEQFTFHWWDHVFNKASSGLAVETGQDGVMVKALDDSNNDLISNKKPRKAQQAKSMLYGSFVKSATLLSGEEQPEKISDSDDSSSSSDDEDHKLDLSSTTKLSDADLLKACGGRTAHKGARHGLTMSAKLARLEQQELEFMNKYGKKNHAAQKSTNPEEHPDATEKTKPKKSKKEKTSENDSVIVNDDIMTDAEPKRKKKKHRKDKDVISIDTDKEPHKDSEHQQTSDRVSKKKRKKKSFIDYHEISSSTDANNPTSAMVITEDTHVHNMSEGQEKFSKKKKKQRKMVEQEVEEQGTCQQHSMPKKKKSE